MTMVAFAHTTFVREDYKGGVYKGHHCSRRRNSIAFSEGFDLTISIQFSIVKNRQ